MSEDLADVTSIDVSELSRGSLAAFANSVLGHALRRRLGVSVGDDGSELDPIAAHESHV